MTGKRQFGTVRKVPSGRWQARIRDGGTNRLVPLGTFPTKAAADEAISMARGQQSRGLWVKPSAGKVTLATYADGWLARRADLRPRTRELYESILTHHIKPRLGVGELGRITSGTVRAWHASLVGATPSGSLVPAKSYRLLRTILGGAVDDELIARNPCILKGVGVESSPERPVATVAEVMALADAVGERHRALVLLATFASLRLGELAGLRRRDVDLLHGTVTVVETVQGLKDGSLVTGPPKSDAGRRTVAIPDAITADLERHLSLYTASAPDALVFAGERGGPLRRNNWNVLWRRAAKAVGVEHLRFHDLRHTGNTLAAATPGVSIKDLMSRMGHNSPAAALRYQHATRDRDATIARALSDLIRPERVAVIPIAEARS